MHALTQLVVRDLLTDATQRSALVAALTVSLMEQMQTFDSSKQESYKTCTCRAYGAHVKALLTHVGDEGVETRMSRDSHVSQVGILIKSRLISYEIRYT
jgi:hypothetical protein